ncbi:MAG: hypothetical protein K0Q63_3523, partial [Paenibacillus sp.]|nr:hypothetical protein [Paenibacillus sp.]
ELGSPLDAHAGVLLAIGRVDDWRDEFSVADRELMLYAIQNIAEEYWSKSVRCLTVSYEKDKLLWLLQPLEPHADANERTVRFIHGTLETIQVACKQMLKLCVSFAAGAKLQPWEAAPEQFGALKRLLGRGLGMGKELILIGDRHAEARDQSGPTVQTHEVRSQLEKLGAMAAYLENGQREHFMVEYGRLMAIASGSPKAEDDSLKLEIYYSLVSLFLSYMNRWGLHEEIGGAIDLGKLSRFDAHRSWGDADDYLAALAERLFEQKHNDRMYREDDLVKHIQWYVEHNLAGDLSLTRIGEVVGYNPYYLTRLYKRITSEGLTDFIMSCRLAKAQKLLAQGGMIVQDISKAIGFMTEQSFYRFFKKATGFTPQEYRERHAISKRDNEK